MKTPESIPLMILHSDIEAGLSLKEGSHADLAPTILDLIGEPRTPSEFIGYSLMSDVEAPVLFLHELPQLLRKEQLYVLSPDGLVQVGYDPSFGRRSIELPEREYVAMLDYIRDVIFARRATEP